MKLHSNKDFVRTANETPKKERLAPQITKWIYYLLVLAILLYIAYFFANRNLTFSAVGVIQTDMQYVYAKRGGSVHEIFVAANDDVSKGDVIAEFAPLDFCEDNRQISELADLHFASLQKTIEIEGLQQQLDFAQAQVSQRPQNKTIIRALELNASLYEEADRSLQSAQAKVKQTQIAVDVAKREHALIQQKITHLKTNRITSADPDCFPEKLIASETGRIDILNIKPSQFVRRGDLVATIVTPDATSVVTVAIPSELYNRFALNQLVDVVFPNGESHIGKVRQILPATAQSHYADLPNVQEQSVIAVLEPADTSMQDIWLRYTQFPVELRGLK